jgi:hypothetical protein
MPPQKPSNLHPMTEELLDHLLEAFPDNVASKMVALVDRGAPRDFVDIHEIVSRDLISLEQCWDLYLQKRQDADIDAAKQQVLEHLERIAARRPLESITAPEDRSHAESVRSWYYEHFSGTGGARLRTEAARETAEESAVA